MSRALPSLGLSFLFLAVPIAAGCKSTIRAYDTQRCSTTSDDDPQYVCTPAQDLVCINTYSIMVTDRTEAAKWPGGIRPVYICRQACSTDMDCGSVFSSEVCCPGKIYGKDYGKMAGCTPVKDCMNRNFVPDAGESPSSDGGASLDAPGDGDAASRQGGSDAGSDAGGDASTGDAHSDAGADGPGNG